MATQTSDLDSQRLREIRLFLEEVCWQLCRQEHVHHDGLAPEDVEITPEFSLGIAGAFADIKIQPKGKPFYFVEVKSGYSAERVVSHLTRKYGPDVAAAAGASKLIVVLDTDDYPDWTGVLKRIEAGINPAIKVEIWDEKILFGRIGKSFGISIDAISEETILILKDAIDRVTGEYAFGSAWTGTPLQMALLWHLSPWRIRRLRREHGADDRALMPPAMYDRIVILRADICSYSSYVRDTADDSVVRDALTAFYAKSRYAVLNSGGMMCQFVGDEIIGLFGIPDKPNTYAANALECAHALHDIGASVANEWQRQIDQVQPAQGVHIGITMGDIQIVPMRPFGRAHLAAVGNEVNMAARLVAWAGPGEIMISNAFYCALDDRSQSLFHEAAPVDARNVGLIKAWKTGRSIDPRA